MWKIIGIWLKEFRIRRSSQRQYLLKEGPHEDDRVLLKRIEERMRWDVRVSSVDIHLKIHDAFVTVTGKVDSAFRRRAALDLVGHTEGIAGYQDSLVVAADFVRTDEELLSIIKAQLATIVLLVGEEISVKVSDGTVYLRGLVYRARPKAYAAGLVWSLSGVRDCINLVEVEAPPRSKRVSIPLSDQQRRRPLGSVESQVSH